MNEEEIVLTPMMKQFLDLKAKHPDAVMLFRCGDFYETYSTDAIVAAEILGITLTKRANGKGKTIEMAGFPHHALDTYLPKLVRAGKRVAICDQLEDPKMTKKLVKRGITELVTPGVSINDNILNYKENNFLAAVHFGKASCGVAFLDISTGEFLTAEGPFDYIDKLLNNFGPKEILFERGKRLMFEGNFGSKFFTFELDDWVFTETTAREKLLKHFETKNLKGFGVEHLKNGIIASGAILQYLTMTQHTQIGHITSLARIEEDKYVRLDKFTVRSLELIGSMNDGGSSLLNVIDRTISPMGARLLKRWIVFPLKDEKPINERLNVVEYFFRQPDFKELIEEQLHLVGDLERIISKVAVGRVSPREVVQLKVALQAIEPIKQACLEADNASLNRIGERLNLCVSIRDRIAREINNDPPLLINKGGVIKDGVNADLDELRRISYSGKDYLLQIQQRESEETGIPSLKVAYNNVFGYYIEVRNVHKDKVPKEWIRKQTLVNAERYITQELKEYEEKILGAEDKILVLETQLYTNLVQALTEFIPQIQVNANQIARLDCLLSFANVARENNYIRPVIEDNDVLDIRQGRHPVIEKQLPIGEKYIANNVMLDSSTQQIIIITGPNMAGKSALLRQTALITLLAQIGSFVPAESAHIGLVDKIFTRVGASSTDTMKKSGAIYVNKLGQRYVDENAALGVLTDKTVEQPDHIAYIVMDAKAWKEYVRKSLEDKLVPNEETLMTWTKIVNNGRSVMAVSDNLADAAKTMGVDPEGLAKTVAHWNDMVKAGKDTDFNRKITGGLAEGPYYIVEQKVRYQTTLGGLKADADLRIFDKAGKPIPGLYGAGCVVGGANGADSLTAMMNSWAIVSGVVSAESAFI